MILSVHATWWCKVWEIQVPVWGKSCFDLCGCCAASSVGQNDAKSWRQARPGPPESVAELSYCPDLELGCGHYLRRLNLPHWQQSASRNHDSGSMLSLSRVTKVTSQHGQHRETAAPTAELSCLWYHHMWLQVMDHMYMISYIWNVISYILYHTPISYET